MLSAFSRLCGLTSLLTSPAGARLSTTCRPLPIDAAVTDAGVVTPAGTIGFGVRRVWPDGSHDLFGFTEDVEAAMKNLDRDRAFWRRGPRRPAAVYLVATSAADVDRHPTSGCLSASCPNIQMRGSLR